MDDFLGNYRCFTASGTSQYEQGRRGLFDRKVLLFI
jgi:hypothetical protein